MAEKAIRINTATGDYEQTADLVESSETASSPTSGGIPRADGAGKIAAGWLPDAIRTVNIQASGGVPTLIDILTLVIGDNLTLTNLGGGEAQIDADDQGGSGVSLTVEEADGSPTVADVAKIVVGNGDLTDNGSGVVRLKTAADATGGSGGGDGIGGLTRISSQTLGAAATNIDFSSIPATYTHLQVQFQGQIDANTNQLINVYFNTDYTAANYQYRGWADISTYSGSDGAVSLMTGNPRAGGSTFANDVRIDIPFYTNTSLVKRANSHAFIYDTNRGGGMVIYQGYVIHSGAANTNALTDIRLNAGVNQFIAGTVVELYGIL